MPSRERRGHSHVVMVTDEELRAQEAALLERYPNLMSKVSPHSSLTCCPDWDRLNEGEYDAMSELDEIRFLLGVDPGAEP